MAELTFHSDVRFARNLLGQFEDGMDVAAVGALNETLDVGVEVAQAAAPQGPPRSDYGRRVKLRENIKKYLLDARSGVIAINAVNAMSQQFGAVPHEIHAVNARNLSFWWTREGVHFVGPKVNHPGNAAQHYMEPGFAAMDERAEGILRKWYGAL